jgi:hypothetical protein
VREHQLSGSSIPMRCTAGGSSSRMTWAIPRLGEGSLSRDLSFQAKGVGVYVTGEAIRSR